MNEKCLPIGTVCTLKGKNKKVMITGFYSVEFSGNLKIKDYCGCVYPEGLLLPEQTCSFNHTDIEHIDFKGYTNQEQLVFERRLKGLTGDEEAAAAEFHAKNDMVLASNKSYSKLLFDENGVVMIAEEAKTPVKSSKQESVKLEVENPFHKEYATSSAPVSAKPSADWKIFNNGLAFSEDGTVVADATNLEEKKKQSLNDIKFDENGVVVAVNTVDEVSSNFKANASNIKFDENGVVISEEKAIPPIGPGLPGYVEPKQESNIKFDENGVVVSEEEAIPPIGPGLPGYVEPHQESNIKFDENGVVVSEEEAIPPIGPGLPGYVEPKQEDVVSE
mgnify:CR=1 FL=1